jgi:hypothetical protein
MERKFIEFFTGLDRNFGYCDLSNAKVNSRHRKIRNTYQRLRLEG